jgi:hypothetical protein
MSGLVELEGDFATYLARLRSLLDPGNLPVSLPLRNKSTESIYGAFLHFTIDPDILEKTGDEVGAFSEQLKVIFDGKLALQGMELSPSRNAVELSLWLSTYFPNFIRSIQTMLSSRNGGSISGTGLERYIKYMGMRYVTSHIIQVGVTQAYASILVSYFVHPDSWIKASCIYLTFSPAVIHCK